MSRRRVRSSFSPSMEPLCCRIAPTVYAAPTPVECDTPLPTVEISTEPTTTYPSSALEMIVPSSTTL